MRPLSGVILLIAGALGCAEAPRETDSSSVAAPEVVVPPSATSAPPSRVIGTIREPFVPYSCDAVARPPSEPTVAHPLAERLLELLPLGQLQAPASPALERAIGDALLAPVDTFSVRDRILIQAVALRAARGGDGRARAASALAQRGALDPSTLEKLGSDPRAELEPWIGSADGWVERRGPSCGPLGTHDGAYEGALAFRTIRSGPLRVLFAQVVALDSELEPHVTPVIGLVELRTSMQAEAPACVLEASAEGLAALGFESLPMSPFIRKDGGAMVGCSGCHTGGGPYDLADLDHEEGGAFRIERRLALLERAKARAGELGLLRTR